jgi:integration host factor subunit beta
MATVTKKELIYRIADRLGHKKVIAKKVVQHFISEMLKELERGNRIEFRDFGVFEIKDRAPRVARNPRTGATIHVTAKRVVHFKPGRVMKEAIATGVFPPAGVAAGDDADD